jgi:hypothetical protein
MAAERIGISRREFARRAAVASAMIISPVGPVSSGSAPSQQPPDVPGAPKLSAQSQAEAESRYESIAKQYGERFTEEQRSDLRRLCYSAQAPLDRLRAYPIQNADSPALYLEPIVERDKRPADVVITPRVKKR